MFTVEYLSQQKEKNPYYIVSYFTQICQMEKQVHVAIVYIKISSHENI